MKDFYINYYELKEPDYIGIYVFLTDREHKKGDPISLENMDCLCWLIYPGQIKELLQQYGHADQLCKLEMIRFKEESDFIIAEMLKKVPQTVVDLMIAKVEIYVNEQIKKQATLLNFINPN